MDLKGKLCLDIGCGGHCQPGFVGMDKRELPGVEIVHDLEKFPWPVDSDTVSVILCSHLIEHIKPWLQVDFLDECWRVLMPGGVLMISTPYGGSFRYIQDPTHCAPWNEATAEYFIEGTPLYQVYRPKPWKKKKLYWYIQGDIEIALEKKNIDD